MEFFGTRLLSASGTRGDEAPSGAGVIVEAIIKYKASDGSMWGGEEGALEREKLIETIDAIMAPMGPTPDLDRNYVSDGAEYVQHEPEAVIGCKVEIVRLCAERFPDQPIFKYQPPSAIHPFSFAGRFLDDVGGPLNGAWNRFMCTDERGREWQQPYLANNTPKKPIEVKRA